MNSISAINCRFAKEKMSGKLFKYMATYLPARLLFYAGDFASWRCWDSEIELIENPRWTFYQWAMRWSLRLDDFGDTGLWSKPKD